MSECATSTTTTGRRLSDPARNRAIPGPEHARSSPRVRSQSRRDLQLALFIDSFNTLNSAKVTSVSQRWGNYYYAYWNHPEESEWVQTSSFETPTSIQQPRVIRIGAKFSF